MFIIASVVFLVSIISLAAIYLVACNVDSILWGLQTIPFPFILGYGICAICGLAAIVALFILCKKKHRKFPLGIFLKLLLAWILLSMAVGFGYPMVQNWDLMLRGIANTIHPMLVVGFGIATALAVFSVFVAKVTKTKKNKKAKKDSKKVAKATVEG